MAFWTLKFLKVRIQVFCFYLISYLKSLKMENLLSFGDYIYTLVYIREPCYESWYACFIENKIQQKQRLKSCSWNKEYWPSIFYISNIDGVIAKRQPPLFQKLNSNDAFQRICKVLLIWIWPKVFFYIQYQAEFRSYWLRSASNNLRFMNYYEMEIFCLFFSLENRKFHQKWKYLFTSLSHHISHRAQAFVIAVK